MKAYRDGTIHHAIATVRHIFNKEPKGEKLAYWYGLALGILNEQPEGKNKPYI